MIYINGSTTIHLRIYEHLKIKLTSWLSFQLEFTFITKTILPNSRYLEVFKHSIYNHRTTKTNQKYPSVNL